MDFAAEAEQKRYARKQAERELYEATAAQLAEELRINNSGVKQTQYHKARRIEATPGCANFSRALTFLVSYAGTKSKSLTVGGILRFLSISIIKLLLSPQAARVIISKAAIARVSHGVGRSGSTGGFDRS